MHVSPCCDKRCWGWLALAVVVVGSVSYLVAVCTLQPVGSTWQLFVSSNTSNVAFTKHVECHSMSQVSSFWKSLTASSSFCSTPLPARYHSPSLQAASGHIDVPIQQQLSESLIYLWEYHSENTSGGDGAVSFRLAVTWRKVQSQKHRTMKRSCKQNYADQCMFATLQRELLRAVGAYLIPHEILTCCQVCKHWSMAFSEVASRALTPWRTIPYMRMRSHPHIRTPTLTRTHACYSHLSLTTLPK